MCASSRNLRHVQPKSIRDSKAGIFEVRALGGRGVRVNSQQAAKLQQTAVYLTE